MSINPALLQLAQRRVWEDAGGPSMEKSAVVPPGGGAPPMDPAAAAGGGAPPMDPAAGAAPPMDPNAAAAGAMGPAPAAMPGGAAPGMAAPGMGVDPATGAPQKMKPEQMMQMLDFRLYNMQMQLTAIMNAMNVELPPGALVTPPGSPVPVAEAAAPGGPQDPTQGGGGNGGGGSSAIGPIEPMQGASPELAAMGGGGGGGAEKVGHTLDEVADMACDPRISVEEFVMKMAEGKANLPSTDGDVDEEGPVHSSSPQPLKGAHPGVRPATQTLTAGGSKDPLSQVGDKTATVTLGRGTVLDTLSRSSVGNNAAAIAHMLRRATAK